MPSKTRGTGRASWRHLYKRKAWEALRVRIMAESEGQCAMCGTLCIGPHGKPDSPVVDHIKPHKGDEALFFDPDNLQLLCKRCHDGTKAREESRGWIDGADADGWPSDPRHPANRRR